MTGVDFGFACLTVGVRGTKQRTCTMKNATEDLLCDLIHRNFTALDNILEYCSRIGIRLFRVSSDIIPFGSHPVNTLAWWDTFGSKLKELGDKATSNGIRLSMHPGQYTVLNSPDDGVMRRAVDDLEYHARFMDAMGLGKEHKIVLHIGGVYGDKTAALARFVRRYRDLNESVRRRLVIENDDRQYSISDVLAVGVAEGIPVVFDNLHHGVNPDGAKSEIGWIDECGRTWGKDDGPQKLHYSQQDPGKRLGSHSASAGVSEFLRFYQSLEGRNVGIMVEAKDKNLSALKLLNATSAPEIRRLEEEWARYKYLVLERSPRVYRDIRRLLKDKRDYPVEEFYRLIDDAVMTPVKCGNAVNAAQHVWGYLKRIADDPAKRRYQTAIRKLGAGGTTSPLKRLLWKLVEEQQQGYLMDSLYFMELVQ